MPTGWVGMDYPRSRGSVWRAIRNWLRKVRAGGGSHVGIVGRKRSRIEGFADLPAQTHADHGPTISTFKWLAQALERHAAAERTHSTSTNSLLRRVVIR